jgi:DNA-binding transcriptional LysR family regulator
MLRDTRALLEHLDEVLDSASGQAGQIRGRIRIACFVTLTPFILPRLISELGSNHPDLEVEVVETQADDVRAVLRNGTAEVALTYDLGLGPGIDTEVLHIARPYVALARDHPLAASAELDLADLAAEPMVLLDLPDSRDYFEKILVDAGVKPRIHYRSASYETVRGMVARGHGFSILNQEPAHHGTYDGGEVVAVPIRGDAPGLPIVIARAHVVRVTARARAIEEAARTIFATDGSR